MSRRIHGGLGGWVTRPRWGGGRRHCWASDYFPTPHRWNLIVSCLAVPEMCHHNCRHLPLDVAKEAHRALHSERVQVMSRLSRTPDRVLLCRHRYATHMCQLERRQKQKCRQRPNSCCTRLPLSRSAVSAWRRQSARQCGATVSEWASPFLPGCESTSLPATRRVAGAKSPQ